MTDMWTDPDSSLPLDVRLALEENPLLRQEVGDLQRRKRAREILAAIEGQRRPKQAPDAAFLAEILARPVANEWRIEGLLPASGRMLLTAQRKTGKTTAIGNLARSLLTGEPFLDRFDVQKIDGNIVVLNYEVTGATFARWMREIGVPADRMFVVNLRGWRNLLADEQGRTELVAMIRQVDGQVLATDPFGRAFTGKSQNDTAEVTPWLGRLDEVAEQAGASELILTAHAGWDGERTRGSTGLEDWPDVIVTMTRDADTGVRFLKAEGRDVQVDEDRLDYDPTTRRLVLSGAGNRRQVRKDTHHDRLAEAVRDVVTQQPGINVSGLRAALRDRDEHLQRGDANIAARVAEERKWIRRERGPRNSWLHYPTDSPPVVPSSPDPSQEPVVSSPDPSYRDGTTTHTPESPTRLGTTRPLGQDIGPCAICSQPTRRYGNDANPLCQNCRSQI